MLDVDAVLAQLTTQEKAALCRGSDLWHTEPIERLGVPAIMVSDGPHGLRAQIEGHGDHLGILASVPATCFPTAAGLGTSWNPELGYEIGQALAEEARRWGVSVVLGPGVNIKRSPLCGRNFEYLSEDPFLAGAVAVRLVEGVQIRGVGTSLKHFAANNQETDRLRVSAEVDERTLREIYLPAFETVVTAAQPWTVMCAYNKVNGTYASEHHWLLTTVLRDEWGFDGLVVSDWGAVHDRVAALGAGLDLEMPPDLERSAEAVSAAVAQGSLSEVELDTMARRVLQLVARAEPALAEEASTPIAERSFDVDAHHALARRAAQETAVLLKNTDGTLPLTPGPGARVAVIGEFARTPRFQGAGSSQVNPTRTDVPLDELTAAFGAAVTVDFAPGFDLDERDRPGSEQTGDRSDARDEELAAAAVELARDADHVVVFLGLPATYESEGFDRVDIDLPAEQRALLERLAAVHDRLVVVLANGSVIATSPWEQHAAAVLECWLGGQAAGGAVADLLTGAANPSGKLAETIPVRLEDNSAFLNFPGDSQRVRYGEGVFVGYRSYDRLDQAVSHPFGFGLSYTTFELSDLDVQVRGSAAAGDLAARVTVSVRNTGERAGAEVVQVYVGDPASVPARPVRELKGFAKVALEPGEQRSVTLELDQRAFAYWSVRLHRWVVEAGEFEIAVGTSSRDLPLRHRLDLDAPSVAPPLTADSTLQEWLHDDQGRALLAQGERSAMFDNSELVKILGTMPLSTLATFGFGFVREHIDEMLLKLRDRAG